MFSWFKKKAKKNISIAQPQPNPLSWAGIEREEFLEKINHRHVQLLGIAGTGKTILLKWCITQWIKNGEAVYVVPDENYDFFFKKIRGNYRIFERTGGEFTDQEWNHFFKDWKDWCQQYPDTPKRLVFDQGSFFFGHYGKPEYFNPLIENLPAQTWIAFISPDSVGFLQKNPSYFDFFDVTIFKSMVSHPLDWIQSHCPHWEHLDIIKKVDRHHAFLYEKENPIPSLFHLFLNDEEVELFRHPRE